MNHLALTARAYLGLVERNHFHVDGDSGLADQKSTERHSLGDITISLMIERVGLFRLTYIYLSREIELLGQSS